MRERSTRRRSPGLFAPRPRRCTRAAAVGLFSLMASLLARGASAVDEPVPVVTEYTMETEPGRADRILDRGPAAATLVAAGKGARAVDVAAGPPGVARALEFDGSQGAKAVSVESALLNRVGRVFTVTVWAKMKKLPRQRKACLISKRTVGYHPTPFILGVDAHGRFVTEGSDGLGWPANFSSDAGIRPGEWRHLAFVWDAPREGVHYVDGRRMASIRAATGLETTGDPLVFGWDDYSGEWLDGFVGRVRIFPVALTAEQVARDKAGTLKTRPARADDFQPPSQVVRLHLTRFDATEAFRALRDGNFDAVTRRPAERRSRPDVVDWPAMTLDGKPCFAEAVEDRELPLRQGAERMPLLRQPYDHVVEPGGHWFRVLEWYWSQKHVYTTDLTANGFGCRYELMTFPVELRGPGDGDISSVSVSVGGKVVYSRDFATGGPGSLTAEVWYGLPGRALDDLVRSERFAGPPDKTLELASFELAEGLGESSGARVRGWLVPPATGEYVFLLASDDNGRLLLGTDDSPANAREIASVRDWTGPRDWNRFPEQRSRPVRLEAGRRYYVEALVKQGTGGAHLSVAWSRPGEAPEVIPGRCLVPFASGPVRSVTLLLPQNERGRPYRLSVNGRAPVELDVGLEPMTPGSPVERAKSVDITIPGAPPIRVRNAPRPEPFVHREAWEKDLAAMAAAAPPRAGSLPPRDWAARVGVEIPRSPVLTYGAYLHAGMSGAWWKWGIHMPEFAGDAAAFAAHLAELGFDALFVSNMNDADPSHPEGTDRLLRELLAKGLRAGVIPNEVNNPNIAFFMHNLPTFWRPCIRDVQLAASRFAKYPNFIGVMTGADNAGYVPYWDWAGPIMNRPWARAFLAWCAGRPPRVPLGPALNPSKDVEARATQREFVEYIRRYDETFERYGDLARAVREVEPNLVYTTGSYGSSPGVGGSGGWPWATIPGRPMHKDLDVMQVYDWNETPAWKPLHSVAMIDRLRSYYPGKRCWTIIDNFGLFFGRETMQRAYALALTRGVTGVGTNFLAHAGSRAEAMAWYRELHDWVRTYGGVFAMTEPLATVGVLYVHEQAISRPIGEGKPDGSHEGKVTEALFVCHAAGFPAVVVTPEELLRDGLRSRRSLKALLLVGLNRFDGTWAWHEGLSDALGEFLRRGGRILADDESDCPVEAERTGMRFVSYINQGVEDAIARLTARNAGNIAKLRATLGALERPVAWSDDPSAWAIPTFAGDVEYLTVVNMAAPKDPAGRPLNDGKFVRPQVAEISWRTERPIYDLRLGRLVSADEARKCDLTKDGFRFYALPPAEPASPSLELASGPRGFLVAKVAGRCRGLPVRLDISGAGRTARVFTATGLDAELPVTAEEAARGFSLAATELLTGRSSTIRLAPPRRSPARSQAGTGRENVAEFASRREVPLVIALTEAQSADATARDLAARLAARFRAVGRRVETAPADPRGVVVGLQLVRPSFAFPQWRTVEADLVLLGSARDNVLIFDQARGGLLDGSDCPEGEFRIARTFSPFVGGFQALSLIASDAAGMAKAVEAVEKALPRAQ